MQRTFSATTKQSHIGKIIDHRKATIRDTHLQQKKEKPTIKTVQIPSI